MYLGYIPFNHIIFKVCSFQPVFPIGFNQMDWHSQAVSIHYTLKPCLLKMLKNVRLAMSICTMCLQAVGKGWLFLIRKYCFAYTKFQKNAESHYLNVQMEEALFFSVFYYHD